MGMTIPVTKLAASLSVSHLSAPIISPASPNLPMGVPASIFLVRAVGLPSLSNKSPLFWLVTKKPGAIAFTRMPDFAKYTASHCVKLDMDAFAPLYAGIRVRGRYAFMLDMLMMFPPVFTMSVSAEEREFGNVSARIRVPSQHWPIVVCSAACGIPIDIHGRNSSGEFYIVRHPLRILRPGQPLHSYTQLGVRAFHFHSLLHYRTEIFLTRSHFKSVLSKIIAIVCLLLAVRIIHRDTFKIDGSEYILKRSIVKVISESHCMVNPVGQVQLQRHTGSYLLFRQVSFGCQFALPVENIDIYAMQVVLNDIFFSVGIIYKPKYHIVAVCRFIVIYAACNSPRQKKSNNDRKEFCP